MISQHKVVLQGSIPYWSWQSEDDRSFRQAVPTYLIEALNKGLVKASGPYRITFLGEQSGEEAVISKLEAESGEIFAVKMTRIPGVVTAEAAFLNAWKRLGVRTPQIVSVRQPDADIPIDIEVMEYISAPILAEAHAPAERITIGISAKMGEQLANIHQAKGDGYGRPSRTNPMKGVCISFAEEMAQEISSRLTPLIDKGILARNTEQLTQAAIDLLDGECKSNLPVLTHCDYKPRNLFLASDGELIVFDPNCRITHPTMCLALSLIRLACEGDGALEEESLVFLSGYRKIERVEEELLKASLLLRGLLILSTWVRKEKVEDSKRILTYLTKHGVLR